MSFGHCQNNAQDLLHHTHYGLLYDMTISHIDILEAQAIAHDLIHIWNPTLQPNLSLRSLSVDAKHELKRRQRAEREVEHLHPSKQCNLSISHIQANCLGAKLCFQLPCPLSSIQTTQHHSSYNNHLGSSGIQSFSNISLRHFAHTTVQMKS